MDEFWYGKIFCNALVRRHKLKQEDNKKFKSFSNQQFLFAKSCCIQNTLLTLQPPKKIYIYIYVNNSAAYELKGNKKTL